MFASLEILIGLVFVYLVLALMVTALTEAIATALRLRAKVLALAVQRMLDRPGSREVTDRFYAHDRIAALSEDGRKPSYIPSNTFAEVLLDLIARHDIAAANVPLLAGPPPAREDIEERFLDTMNRASGWYKRRATAVAGAVSIAVVILANADTLSILRTLWTSPAVRAVVVAQAEQRAQLPRPRGIVDANYANVEDPVPSENEDSAEVQDEADGITADDRAALEALIGWTGDFKAFNAAHCERLQQERDTVCRERGDEQACSAVLQRIATDQRCEVVQGDLASTAVFPGDAVLSAALVPIVLGHLVGWILSIAAVSLGAPFWFDMLSRFVNVRGVGPAERPKQKGDLRVDRRTFSEAEATPTPKENQ